MAKPKIHPVVDTKPVGEETAQANEADMSAKKLEEVKATQYSTMFAPVKAMLVTESTQANALKGFRVSIGKQLNGLLNTWFDKTMKFYDVASKELGISVKSVQRYIALADDKTQVKEVTANPVSEATLRKALTNPIKKGINFSDNTMSVNNVLQDIVLLAKALKSKSNPIDFEAFKANINSL